MTDDRDHSEVTFSKTHALSIGARAQMVQLGDLVGGSYRLEALLGHGGMGYVFRARHTTIEKNYALKIVNPDVLDAKSARRFSVEARVIAKLDHPNIVKIYNMGMHENYCPFYVMELMEGEALSHYIDRGDDISLQQGLDIFYQVAAGLAYAHSKGIVHRDVKPSNIILLPSGESYEAKIVDFGIAKVLNTDGQSLTVSGEVLGTPYYMSPEQCLGKSIDARADIYSLGCSLFQTITGSPPFMGATAIETLMMHMEKPVPKLVDLFDHIGLAEQFDLLIGRMMAKDIDARYQSMEQVVRHIERLKGTNEDGKSRNLYKIDRADSGTEYDTGSLSASSSTLTNLSWLSSAWSKLNLRLANLVLLFAIGSIAVSAGFWLSRDSGLGQKYIAPKPVAMLAAIRPNAVTDLTSASDSSLSPARKAEIKDAFFKLAPIKSRLIRKNNESYREFVFPQMCIGDIIDASSGLHRASGQTIVSASGPLILTISRLDQPLSFDVPETLSAIGANEFASVRLRQSEVTSFDGDRLALMFDAMRGWRKLNAVVLDNFDETQKTFDSMAKITHLSNLCLAHPRGQLELLARSPLLMRLEVLQINAPEKNDGDSVIRALVSSKKIKELYFRKVQLSDDAIGQLEHNASIKVLTFNRMNVTDRMVQSMVKVRSLTDAIFQETHVTYSNLSLLEGCEHIKRIGINASVFSRAELQRLRKFKKVTVNKLLPDLRRSDLY